MLAMVAGCHWLGIVGVGLVAAKFQSSVVLVIMDVAVSPHPWR